MTPSPWRARLQPASFRGAAFEVESNELSAGRRVQLHEYPQRDRPYSEDLGRATRELTLTAFVIGPDFMGARDRLLAALEQPGPGTLVHPHWGSMQVVARSARVSHSNADAGLARFDLSFVEAGELSFPTAASATDQRVQLAADGAVSALQAQASAKLSVTGSSLLQSSMLADATKLVSSARQRIAQYVTITNATVTALLSSVSSGNGNSIAGAVLGLYHDLEGVAEMPTRVLARLQGAIPPALSRYLRASSALVSSAAAVPTGSIAQTPAGAALSVVRQQQAYNTVIVQDLFRGAALIAAARALTLSSLPVHDDAVAVRDRLTDAFDVMAQTATDDTVCNALQALRVAVFEDVTTRARQSARLATLMPPAVLPALVVAYDWSEDASRDLDLVERNGIRHPGFVPVRPLLVLETS